MGRRQGHTGHVKWPTRPIDGRIHDSGEGGMWVYAFIRCRYNLAIEQPMYADAGLGILDTEESKKTITFWDDPFIKCCGPDHVIGLPLPDVVVSANRDDLYPPERSVEQPIGKHVTWEDREEYVHYLGDAGTAVLAAVCLGTCGHSWFDDQADGYWQCRFADLTWRGKAIVRRLEKLYGRAADLVTYLDT